MEMPDFATLKYAEVQKLAKKAGIKANVKVKANTLQTWTLVGGGFVDRPKKNGLLSFYHISESRFLSGALLRSKFANFCHDSMEIFLS